MPEWRHEIGTRLNGLDLSPARAAEICDELSQHLDDRFDELVRDGVADDDARRLALDELDDHELLRRGLRPLRQASISNHIVPGLTLARWLSGFWQDVRYAVRSLRRSSGLASVAVFVLALGIGLNSAVFSVVSAVFFRQLPVSAPEQLVYVYDSGGRAIDIPIFRQHAGGIFSGVTDHSHKRGVFSAAGWDQTVYGEHVTASYFKVLGVAPVLGRAFRPEEDDPTNESRAVVISDHLWNRRFQRDPNVLGKVVRIDDKAFTVVGVAARGFVGLSDVGNPSRYWIIEAQYYGAGNADVSRVASQFSKALIARLEPGRSLKNARTMLSARSAAADVGSRTHRYRLVPAEGVMMPSSPDMDLGWIRALAWAVTGVVALVLLIAAANLAGILMARGVVRGGELAVRRAMGAGTARLVRQLLTESVLLSAAGGLAGLFVAWLLLTLYRALSPDRFVLDASVDIRVLLFTALVCIGAGLVVGLAPARQALAVDVVSSLGGGDRTGTTRRVRRRLRHAVVIPQIALSIILLVVAAVHVHALLSIELADLGYRTEHVVVLRTGFVELAASTKPTDAERAERNRATYRQLLERVRQVPGAAGAALASGLPVQANRGVPRIFTSRDGSGDAPRRTAQVYSGFTVSDGYFRVLGISLRSGRDFDRRDTIAAPRVAIISESLARQLWPAGDALGKSLAWAGFVGGPPNANLEWREVIGIVSDVRPALATGGEHRSVYTPAGQIEATFSPFQVVAWGPGGQDAKLIEQLRQAIVAGDPLAQVPRMETVTEVIAEELYPRRAAAWLVGISGAAGLFLAAIGLYGVISYSVAQQRRDFGVRSALGAGQRDLIALVLHEGANVAVMAAVPGVIVSYIALRLTSRLVGPVPMVDGVAFLAVSLLMAAVIFAACYVPARRAARVDPMVALRGD